MDFGIKELYFRNEKAPLEESLEEEKASSSFDSKHLFL
jgi:hypothetical protein